MAVDKKIQPIPNFREVDGPRDADTYVFIEQA